MLSSQDKIKTQHCVPLHADVILAIKPLSEGRSDEDALRKKYAPKITTSKEKVRKAQQAVERETSQASQAKMQTAVSVGATLLGAFMGRKAMSTRRSTGPSPLLERAGRSIWRGGDIKRAEETVAEYQRRLDDLNAQFQEETNALEAKIDTVGDNLMRLALSLRRSTSVVQLSLVWAPYLPDVQGRIEPAW